jgi:hypothetical protein
MLTRSCALVNQPAGSAHNGHARETAAIRCSSRFGLRPHETSFRRVQKLMPTRPTSDRIPRESVAPVGCIANPSLPMYRNPRGPKYKDGHHHCCRTFGVSIISVSPTVTPQSRWSGRCVMREAHDRSSFPSVVFVSINASHWRLPSGRTLSVTTQSCPCPKLTRFGMCGESSTTPKFLSLGDWFHPLVRQFVHRSAGRTPTTITVLTGSSTQYVTA